VVVGVRQVAALSLGRLFFQGLRLACPSCHQSGAVYPRYSFRLNPCCTKCGLDFAQTDFGDAAPVLLIFVLGALTLPLALWVEALLAPPLWLHALLWPLWLGGLTLCLLRAVHSIILALNFHFRPMAFMAPPQREDKAAKTPQE
jgi:uncharacterized protein (DUF983 family)